jgi:hypothetical protein
MERSQVLAEYWSLRKSLNQGNKPANEKTTVVFIIESLPLFEYRLVVSVRAEQEVRKIELVRRDRDGTWERSGFTRFKTLENYCASILNEGEEIKVVNFDIKILSNLVQNRFEKLLMD